MAIFIFLNLFYITELDESNQHTGKHLRTKTPGSIPGNVIRNKNRNGDVALNILF